LTEIDALQKFESMSGNDFSIGDAMARERIAAAQADARTRRDRSIAFGREEYLEMTEPDQQTLQRDKLFQKMRPALTAKDEDCGETSGLEAAERLNLRLILHRALD